MAKFNINNADVVELTNRLEKIHKSAMPVSVRGALNDAAFDMKKNQLGKTFDSDFTIRKKTFIRSHSAFNRSKNTFNINEMSSEAGIIKGKSKSGDELEIQETGGSLSGRKSIVTPEARISKSGQKLVSRRFYLQNLKGKGVIFKNKRQRIFASNDTIIQNIRGEKNFRVLYRFRNTRSYDATHFVEKAGELSSKKIPDFFLKQAKRRLNK